MNVLGVNEVVYYEKYLGIVIYIGRLKKKLFFSIKDRVCKKLYRWMEKLLSWSEREVFISNFNLRYECF